MIVGKNPNPTVRPGFVGASFAMDVTVKPSVPTTSIAYPDIPRITSPNATGPVDPSTDVSVIVAKTSKTLVFVSAVIVTAIMPPKAGRGRPQINTPDFVPDYPGRLPMDIGDGLKVHLRKCSIPQVRDVFMEIEKPEKPIDIPVAAALVAAAPTLEFDTIGGF